MAAVALASAPSQPAAHPSPRETHLYASCQCPAAEGEAQLMPEKAYEKHAWMILFAVGALLFYLALFIIVTAGSADPDLQEVAGMTRDELASISPGFASYLVLGSRTLGVILSGVAFFGMAISLKSYRRGEKWSWYALWYFPVLFGLSAALELGAGGVTEGRAFAVLFGVSLLGLLLPYRKFFPKS